jgi:signal transduction histidine kinase
VGVHALHTAPALGFPSGFWFSLAEPQIQRIADLELDTTASLRLPEFFSPREEAAWWRVQEQLYVLLRTRKSVPVAFLDQDGRWRTEEVRVGALPMLTVLKRIWLIYLVVGFCLGSAVAVFRRHLSSQGTILAFFLLACALYFVASAPVVARSVTLAPAVFRMFVVIIYTAAAGFVTFPHFALVFPEPKPFLRTYPWLAYVPYGCFLVAEIPYLLGISAFGSAFPLLSLGILTVVAAFLHSMIKEGDPFLRKQISLSLVAPILVSLFFVGLYLLPGVLRLSPVDFRYFAVFFLILPFALPLAMDNLVLYHARLEAERAAQREKEHLRADLHDVILNNLAIISRASEVAQTRLGEQGDGVARRLESIRELATTTSRQLREFLWVLDDRHGSWETFCSQLRQWGHELLEDAGCEFELEVAPFVLKAPPPALRVRICLDRIYKEALHNVIKHAGATRVQAAIFCRGETLVCAVHDNGVGFNPALETNGRYGLKNMRRRVEDLGGRLKVESRQHQGTRLTVELPLT